MAHIFFKKKGRKPSLFASLGLMITLFAAICLVSAGPLVGYIQSSLASADYAFTLRIKLTLLTTILLMLASLLTAIGILHGRYSVRVRTSWRGFLAALLALGIAAPTWMMYDSYKEHPIIHDVSTNLEMPPFFNFLPERQYKVDGPADLTGGRLAPNYLSDHQDAYPELKTLTFQKQKSAVLNAVQEAIQKLGWQIVYQNEEKGRIEAISLHPWLQQRNNIVVRVRADAAQSMLDIRSVSALEVGDFGVNANLIRALQTQVQENIG